MLYELAMTYDNGTMKKERADLPTLMHCLSYYMDEEPWNMVEITNCQTGEVIAVWSNTNSYGVTCIG